jgi:hypothetical protein
MNELEKEINENMSKIWIPANLGVVDETMVSFKGTKDNLFRANQIPTV